MKLFNFLFLFFYFLFLISCKNRAPKSIKGNFKFETKKTLDSNSVVLNKSHSNLYLVDSLIDIQAINPKIKVDLKYSTTDNFMNTKLYDVLKKAYLQKDVAERLSECQKYLESIHPDYSLLVYDAVRPVSVQQKMWNALDSIPPAERGKFVSNPKNRSLHNMGAAVDLTIINEIGIPLDMGAGYDDIRKIAYPIFEKDFFNSGELSKEQLGNRELLRKVMKHQEFRQLETEWWHFNACSRNEAKAKYKVLLNERDLKH